MTKTPKGASSPNAETEAGDGGKASAAKPKFRRRAEARKDEVLDAALELFTKNGFAATRVEDIATKAGISKGTVYLYFDSKEAVMAGLIDRALSPMATTAITAIDKLGVDPRMVFKAIGGMIAHNLSDPKVIAIPKLILRESANFPELAMMYRRNVIDRVLPPMVKLIEHQIALGRFKPVNAELAIRSIIGPIVAHMVIAEVFHMVPEGGMQMDRLVEQHIEIFFNGIQTRPEN